MLVSAQLAFDEARLAVIELLANLAIEPQAERFPATAVASATSNTMPPGLCRALIRGFAAALFARPP